MRLRQDGLVVYGFGGASKTPAAFRQHARAIDVECADQGRFGQTANPQGPSGHRRVLDHELVELLGDCLCRQKRDEKGFAPMGEVGKIAGNRSSFDTAITATSGSPT